MKILDITAKNILENFQTAYSNQIGRRMVIGSEEFTLSSIFSYALESFTGLLNKSYKNAFTATAEGKYLDNLAARYSLSRNAEQWAKPFFDCRFKIKTSGYTQTLNAGAVTMQVGGEIYKNTTEAVISPNFGEFACTMTANNLHNAYVDTMRIRESVTKAFVLNNQVDVEITDVAGSGIQQCGRYYTSDKDFREYIQRAKYLYNSGVAGAFESVTKAYADFILDAKCATQDQESPYYTPGYVDLYIKPDLAEFQILRQIGSTDALTNKLKDIMSGNPLNTLTVGQQLRIYIANRYNVPARVISVKLPANMKDYSWVVDDGSSEPPAYTALEVCELKIACLNYYYNQKKLKLGEPLFWTTYQQDLTNPLSALSTDKNDFGPAVDDQVWEQILKDFAIEGISSGATKVVVPAAENLNFFLYLTASSVTVGEIQYTVEELKQS